MGCITKRLCYATLFLLTLWLIESVAAVVYLLLFKLIPAAALTLSLGITSTLAEYFRVAANRALESDGESYRIPPFLITRFIGKKSREN